MSDFTGSIAVGGLIVSLGGWVYLKNLHSPINRIFFLLAISTSISVFSSGLEDKSLVPYLTYPFLRIEFAAALAVPLSLFSRSQFLPRALGAGNYGFLLFIGFTTYAIFKYRFMDIRVIIRQTTVYLAGLLMVLILGLFLWHPLSSYFSLPPVVNLCLILLCGVVVFQLAHSRIQRIANLNLFSGLYWTQKNVKSSLKA